MERKYDSSVARIAGNIASGMVGSEYYRDYQGHLDRDAVARLSVRLARAIVNEVKDTEPK